jgi:hypothetical protein
LHMSPMPRLSYRQCTIVRRRETFEGLVARETTV